MDTQNAQTDTKSKQELKDLIKEWESNPNWDLHTSPGFEDYEHYLKNYQKRKEIEWAKAKARRTRRAARSMGWKEFKGLADAQRLQASTLMLHLVYGTNKVDEEQQTIVDAIMDHIFRGSINYAKAEMIQDSYALQ